MLRARNIMLILVINYALIVLVCMFGEFSYIGVQAQHVQTLIATAADMALDQAQATDDFFLPSGGYMLEDRNTYTMKMPNALGNFTNANVFQVVTGTTEKEDMFKYLYGTDDYKNFVTSEGYKVQMSAGFINPSSQLGRIEWAKVPRIAQVGSRLSDGTTINPDLKAYVRASTGGSVSTAGRNSIWRLYQFDNAQKTAYSNGSTVNYYMTPISLGITYFNKELLQTLFMNNMDLLMRAKYARTGEDLNTEDGGNGIYQGVFYADLLKSRDRLGNANPINDGYFTLLRGPAYDTPVDGVKKYIGVEPEITYKVIDLYSDSSNNLLETLFGGVAAHNEAAKNAGYGVNSYSSVADYFRSRDRNIIDYSTGLPYEHKAIVVAQITFKADIIVPYTMPVVREMRGHSTDSGTLGSMILSGVTNNGGAGNNWMDIRRSGSGESSQWGNGSELFTYTTLFAVAP